MSDKPLHRRGRPSGSAWLVMAAVFAAGWLLWPTTRPNLPTAQAQIPDPAAQRGALQCEMQKVHAELVEIRKLLASGKLQVVVSQETEQPPRGSSRHGP